MKIRIGNGFDVHKLQAGTSITLCGLNIPHTQELLGHSDADVALHALTDSIFGALCEGDIGVHFPPTDEKWRDVESKIFLQKALILMDELRYSISNLDITIVCEAPKIKDHSLAMRTNIANICKIKLGQVSVKGTTSERLGFTGRQEGIAALATILLEKNE